LGLEEGRYVVRDQAEEVERVLVVADARAPAHLRRRARRRARARRAAEAIPAAPIRRLTVIEPTPLDSADAAAEWLRRARDEQTGEQIASRALAVVNRALHAAALAAGDPHPRELGIVAALVVRAGVGSGDEVAEGRWSEALELPGPGARRERRADSLHSDERFAAILGGRESPPPSETLLLRARADLEAGRSREAALQLRAAVEALLADAGAREALEGQGEEADRLARKAAGGPLDAEAVAALAKALASCERVVRRRAVNR
jgi:hypothetical protein